ncbi:MAG: S9 family peptidase [bacterium]|nr:S9 family peptidase [bacterium]
MRKISFVALVFAALVTAVHSQEKLLTIDDIFSPDPAVRVPFGGTTVRISWTADGRSFRQLQNGRLVRVNAETGQATPFYDDKRFAAALVTVAKMTEADANRMANSVALQFDKNESAILLTHASDVWHYAVATGILKRLTETAEEEAEVDFSPDGKWVSYVRQNNLYVVEVDRGRTKQLTRDGSKNIYNGALVWVYEEELYGRGNKRGYWWSPDSSKIAFLRLDDSKVPPFMIANDTVTDQVIENTPYPQPGDPNPIVRLGVADVTRSSFIPNAGLIPGVGRRLPASVQRIGDSVRWANLNAYKPEDLLIARVTWSRDSGVVMYQALNREQTFLDLNGFDLSGKPERALQETTAAWVEVYDNPAQLKDGSFLWQSAKNGWRHLYHYDGRGKLIRQLTDGKWEIRELFGVDPDNAWAYFSATKDSHIAVNIYRVKIADGTVERLSQGEGSHSALFNSTFTHYVGGWSDINTPPKQRIYKSDGSLVRTLNENQVDALAQYKLGSSDFLQVKTRDGFEMEAMMIRPPDFNANKKYPVLIYTYAGPHAPQVRNGWGASRYVWFQMLAQKGYVVWVCDNRSASGKGEESVWPIYKNMGPLELRDIEDGVSYLKSLTFIDPERIGVFGWSYGGFMTSYALTHTKSFKIGIAGGTVSDWALYDSIYTERFMLTPQNNRDGYAKTSVLNKAKDLHGRLLLIHGMMDDNVHMQNTTKLVFELQKAGKQFDLMLYPTQRHGITNPAQVHHWYSMMTDYVLKNL